VSPEELYRVLLAECEAEFAGFALRKKDESRLQRAIDRALKILTLGGQRHYLDQYQTTIGRTVWVTSDWDTRPAAERYSTLRHERIHLRQFQRLGLPLMAVLYLGVLPVGLAWFRARFEKEAYEESLRAWAEMYGPEHVRRADVRAEVVSRFTGPAYGWMWPFRRSIEAWYDRAAKAAVGPRAVPEDTSQPTSKRSG
jgi:hypothetical protein